MAKYNSRVQGLISDNDKAKLEAIKKENSDISIRFIIEDFIKDYCSTNPKGIKITIKELENRIDEIDEQINNLHEDRTQLEIKLKAYKDKLNHTLDNYMDVDLKKSVESLSKICNERDYTNFEDIPEEVFISISKYNKISVNELKETFKKQF